MVRHLGTKKNKKDSSKTARDAKLRYNSFTNKGNNARSPKRIQAMKKTDAATKKALAAEIAANEAKAAKPAKTKGPSKAKMAELEARIIAETEAEAEQAKPEPTPAPAIKIDGRNRPETWVLSSTPKPTKKVWVVAEDMPGASRKEVIAECIKRGIAPGTSRTQYQAWFKATRDSQPA